MDRTRMLADITGTVERELLLRNEYPATENRILKAQLKGRPLLSDTERASLGEIGHRLGRKALEGVAAAARPETVPGWYRQPVARKFAGSKRRLSPSRPRVDRQIEDLVVRMAQEFASAPTMRSPRFSMTITVSRTTGSRCCSWRSSRTIWLDGGRAPKAPIGFGCCPGRSKRC